MLRLCSYAHGLNNLTKDAKGVELSFRYDGFRGLEWQRKVYAHLRQNLFLPKSMVIATNHERRQRMPINWLADFLEG